MKDSQRIRQAAKRNLVTDNCGISTTELGLILAAITVAGSLVLPELGGRVEGNYEYLGQKLADYNKNLARSLGGMFASDEEQPTTEPQIPNADTEKVSAEFVTEDSFESTKLEP